MKGLALTILTSLFFLSAQAQVKKADGTWWDNNLAFDVLYENLDSTGELMICILNTEAEKCIENLTTGFQVSIYGRNDKELTNSLWTGKNMYIKFKTPFPEAEYIVIKANKNYVVNTMTGTRIYQDEPIEFKYILE